MNIVIFAGSGRRNGNTDQITSLIAAHLRAEAQQQGTPLEIETIYLGQENLQFCRGCRICYDRGEQHCPAKDGLLGLKAKMEAADGVILASPVYVDDVSGLMKNFIDRLCHVCHRPQFAGKVAYAIATTGSSRTNKTLDTMTLALRVWGFHVIGQHGFKMGALMKREESLARFDAQAARSAHQVFQAIAQGSSRSPTFFSLMMFKIQQMGWQVKAQPDTLDYRYWEEQGWFAPGRTYFIDHQAGWLKVALARLTGIVVAKIMG